MYNYIRILLSFWYSK